MPEYGRKPRQSAPSSLRCVAGVAMRVMYLVVALRLHVDVDVSEGRGGGWRLRSGRSAADPSPAVHGPGACNRRPRAAAISWSAVLLHALDD